MSKGSRQNRSAPLEERLALVIERVRLARKLFAEALEGVGLPKGGKIFEGATEWRICLGRGCE